MRRWIWVLGLVALGCTSARQQNTRAQSDWVGRHVSELEARWGEPTGIEELLDGDLVYTWDQRETRAYLAPGHGPGGTQMLHDPYDTFIRSEARKGGPQHGAYTVGTALSATVNADGVVTAARVIR